MSTNNFDILNAPGWITSVTHHCGSKNGRSPGASEPGIYERATAEFCNAQPSVGIESVLFGGGRSGLMGLVAKTSLQAGLRVRGISLAFFDAAQGGELEGVEPTITADGMRDRKQQLRHGAQVAILHPGGNGSFEEAFEWLNSRNSIVKPVVALNIDGFYEGMKQFLDRFEGFSSPLQRIFFENSAGGAIDRLRLLNGAAPIQEREAEDRLDISPYVSERENAVIVLPGPLKVIEVMMERNVGYDLSNAPNVKLRDSTENGGRWDVNGKELYLPDKVLKPIIFAGAAHFEGLRIQFDASRSAGFIAEGREELIRFVDTKDEAEDLAVELAGQEPLTPADLLAKHSETSPEYAVDMHDAPGPKPEA